MAFRVQGRKRSRTGVTGMGVSQSLWTTMVQSLVVLFRNFIDICPVRFPDIRGAYDFHRDAKGGEPSEELGTHCYIDMCDEVLIIHWHDYNIFPKAVDNDADKFAATL